MANLVASAMLRQSMSQKRADTVVVKLTQSFTKVNGVDPVTSSHWARVVPPREKKIASFLKCYYRNVVIVLSRKILEWHACARKTVRKLKAVWDRDIRSNEEVLL